jgi:hypothetical protein
MDLTTSDALLQYSSFAEEDDIRQEELQQEMHENELIECTREWFKDLIALNEQDHGTLVIEGEDWNMHLRENSGGAVGAHHLTNSFLWFRMSDSIVQSGTIKEMLYNEKDYDLKVTW